VADVSHNDFWEYLREHKGSRLVDSVVVSQIPQSSGSQSYKVDRLKGGFRFGNQDHSFFSTDDETFGIEPPKAKNGDVVCVLLGSQLPFVLRPCTDHYHLVGWWFVHGIWMAKSSNNENGPTKLTMSKQSGLKFVKIEVSAHLSNYSSLNFTAVTPCFE
jgi:hypothetical protein